MCPQIPQLTFQLAAISEYEPSPWRIQNVFKIAQTDKNRLQNSEIGLKNEPQDAFQILDHVQTAEQ